MKKYSIVDVQVGVSEGGMACGPVGGHVIAEVQVRDLENNKIAFHSLAEVDGTLNFMLTDESTFDGQIKDDYQDTQFWDKISEAENGGYSDYNEFYEDLEKHEICDEDCALIWKYLAYMVRADWSEIDQMKNASIGKVFGEFAIPVCDAEEEYLEEMEDEE